MAPKIPSLQLFYDRQYVAEIPMNRTLYTVGRKAGCNLRLLETSVSREHCRFLLEKNGTVLVEDVASTNGTLVNDQRTVRTRLKPNDVVTLGRVSLIFHELAAAELQRPQAGFWNTLRRKNKPVPFSESMGGYVLPLTDVVTEFDSISYGMVRDQGKLEAGKASIGTYLREIPRLQVIGQKLTADSEITRFEIPESSLHGETAPKMRLRRAELPVFAQPAAKGSRIKIPWKPIEWTLIPAILAVALFFLGRFFLSFQIGTEMERAERHWNEKLTRVADRYKFADDSVFTEEARPVTRVASAPRRIALSTEEVFKRIDAQPSLRNFLLFEILDDLLGSEQMKWSLEEALRRLSQVQSLTTRLPSVKNLHIVLNQEGTPFKMEGLTQSRVLFLSDRGETPTEAMTYAEYRAEMTPRLAPVNSCSAVRTSPARGMVVLAFTVGASGRVASVFINKTRSTKETELWRCVEEKLKTIPFGAPPGGPISVVYTFNFAGPQKMRF